MKTASMVLGIVSGVIAIIFGLALILGSVILMNMGNWDEVAEEWNSTYVDGQDWQEAIDDFIGEWENSDNGGWRFRFNIPRGMLPGQIIYWAFSTGGIIVLFGGIVSTIGGIVGLIGGCIVKRKNVAAGVMMIVAAVLCFIGLFNVVSMLMFVLGGIFALVRERPKSAAAFPPSPPPYPYNAYPLPPQQPVQPQQPTTPEESAPEEPGDESAPPEQQ